MLIVTTPYRLFSRGVAEIGRPALQVCYYLKGQTCCFMCSCILDCDSDSDMPSLAVLKGRGRRGKVNVAGV